MSAMSVGARITAAAAAVTFVVSACSSSPTAPSALTTGSEAPSTVIATGGGKICLTGDAVVYLTAVHLNAVAGIPVGPLCAADQAVESGKPVGVISVEGTPRVLMPVVSRKPQGNNDMSRKADKVRIVTELARAAQGAVPSSDGNDLTAALALAVDSARSAAGANATIQLIVTDPGLSDRGAVDLTAKGAFVAEPEDVAAHVKNAGQCPKLSNTSVAFIGLGYPLAPQPELTIADRDRVSRLWSLVVAQCQGQATLIPGKISGAAPTTAHPVTPVVPSGYPPFQEAGSFSLVGDSALAFQADATAYLHPDQASAFLDTYARYLTSHPRTAVLISGQTANYSTRWPSLEALATARAEQVKADLVVRGVSATRLTTKGLGYQANPPQVDAATAALNRSVTFSASPLP